MTTQFDPASSINEGKRTRRPVRHGGFTSATTSSGSRGWRSLPARLRRVRTGALRRFHDRLPVRARSTFPRSTIKVDSILDDFSQYSLEHELVLRPVSPRHRPDRTSTDLLFAESAWVGNGGRWRHRFSHFHVGNELDALVQDYRAKGIPTAFWNKEDPAHFDTFIEVAACFDHVLTTDAACVDRYRATLGHQRVSTMPFAAQPALHNPIGHKVDGRSICFAGAWRGDVHPQRIAQLTTLLDAALATGDLTVFARRPADGGDDFPERYRPAIVGEIPYEEMVVQYRRHACFLNVNTVTDSPTMMSRRVFEILACRTPVVSSPSPAIERFFGDAVPTPSTLDEATTVLSELVHDPVRRDRLGQLGYRSVMTSHTYQHRIAAMCRELDIDGFPEPELPSVDAVVEVGRRSDIERVLADLEPLRRGLDTVVVAVPADGDTTTPTQGERSTVHVIEIGPDQRADSVLQRLPGQAEFVAFLDADAHYGRHVITDALLATRFVDADVYGKALSHIGDRNQVTPIGAGDEFSFEADLVQGFGVVRRAVLAGATPSAIGDRRLGTVAVEAGSSRFSVDRFNHIAPGPTSAVRLSANDVIV